jgi:hypothetical protein
MVPLFHAPSVHGADRDVGAPSMADFFDEANHYVNGINNR